MDYLKLHKTIETSKVSFTDLCKKIHLTRKTLYNNIENKTLKVETLEKICKELKVPVTSFFSETQLSSVSESSAKYNKTPLDNNDLSVQLQLYRDLYETSQKTVTALTMALEMLNKKAKH